MIKILLTAVGSGIVLWGFFIADLLPFGYRRVAAQHAELKAEYDDLSREVEKARLMVDGLPELEKEQLELEEQWKQAEALLPSDREVSGLLTQITQAGEQSGVAFELFKPGAVTPKDFYSENPVEVRVTAGFHQLGMFLSRLANLARLVNVEKLQLEGKKQEREEKEKPKGGIETGPNLDHTLTASFMATAYSLSEAQPADLPPAEAGAETKIGAKQNIKQNNANTRKAKAKAQAQARAKGGAH
jgi:Tfp pilus assembly protein PilO